MVIDNHQLSFQDHHDIKPEKILTLKADTANIQASKFQFKADTFKPQKKVRDAGYEFTKEEFKKFHKLHQQNIEVLKNKKKAKYANQEEEEDKFEEEEIDEEYSDREPAGTKLKQEKERPKQQDSRAEAAITIQKVVRGSLQRNENVGKKKTKLAQFVDNQENQRISLVALTQKYSMKRRAMKYKLVVKNQNKAAKDKPKVIELQKLPIEKELIIGYLHQCLEIIWKGKQIESVTINAKKLNRAELLQDYGNQVLLQSSMKQQTSIKDQKPVVEIEVPKSEVSS